MGIEHQDLETRLRTAFPQADIAVTDLAGDNEHYAAKITCASFAGLNRVQQHQRVYAAIGAGMGTELHALQLTTGVPADTL
ncbi:MAG: BolA/IbaG family iron-sulfur metabolism protein [Pseudomonadota bacterium]